MEKYEGKLIEDQEQDSFLSYSSKGLNTIERIKKNGIDYFPDKNYCDKIVIKINVRDSDLSHKLTNELFSCYQDLREMVTFHYTLPEIKEMVDEKGRLLSKLEEINEERKRYNTYKKSKNIKDIESMIKKEDSMGYHNSFSYIKDLYLPSKEEDDEEIKKEYYKEFTKIEVATEFYKLVCEHIIELNFIKKYFHAYYTKSSDFMIRLLKLLYESKKSLKMASSMIDAVQNFSEPDDVAKWDLDE